MLSIRCRPHWTVDYVMWFYYVNITCCRNVAELGGIFCNITIRIIPFYRKVAALGGIYRMGDGVSGDRAVCFLHHPLQLQLGWWQIHRLAGSFPALIYWGCHSYTTHQGNYNNKLPELCIHCTPNFPGWLCLGGSHNFLQGCQRCTHNLVCVHTLHKV